jgi:hypothetical protein
MDGPLKTYDNIKYRKPTPNPILLVKKSIVLEHDKQSSKFTLESKAIIPLGFVFTV